MLELSRPSYKTICQKGAGGISVKNKLSKNVAVCRTDYPGSESETVPLDCAGGATLPVTNPIASEYYEWEGAATSAQYYINPAGASVSDACKWGSAGSNMGNWAPVNMGVGTTDFGTFLSIFPNAPTNPDGTLDFNIKITGDVTGKCEYKNGQYYTNGVVSPTGCTVSSTHDILKNKRLTSIRPVLPRVDLQSSSSHRELKNYNPHYQPFHRGYPPARTLENLRVTTVAFLTSSYIQGPFKVCRSSHTRHS
jgi:hypothetical protein